MPNNRQADLFRQTHRRLADSRVRSLRGFELCPQGGIRWGRQSLPTQSEVLAPNSLPRCRPLGSLLQRSRNVGGTNANFPSWTARLERNELTDSRMREQLGEEEMPPRNVDAWTTHSYEASISANSTVSSEPSSRLSNRASNRTNGQRRPNLHYRRFDPPPHLGRPGGCR